MVSTCECPSEARVLRSQWLLPSKQRWMDAYFETRVSRQIQAGRVRGRLRDKMTKKNHLRHFSSTATSAVLTRTYSERTRKTGPLQRLRSRTLEPVQPIPFSTHLFLPPAMYADNRIRFQEEFPVRDFPAGYGPASTAAIGAKPPTITTLRYTGPAATDASTGEDDAELLMCGCDDGAVTVRPALAAGVYARVQAHDGDAVVAAAACSCDGEWIVSGDSNGVLAVHRLRREPFEVGSVARGAGKEASLLRWLSHDQRSTHVFLKLVNFGSIAVLLTWRTRVLLPRSVHPSGLILQLCKTPPLSVVCKSWQLQRQRD